MCEVQGAAGRALATGTKPIRARPWGITLRCTIGTPLADTQSRLHPSPGGVWRVREKLRSVAGNSLAAVSTSRQRTRNGGSFHEYAYQVCDRSQRRDLDVS